MDGKQQRQTMDLEQNATELVSDENALGFSLSPIFLQHLTSNPARKIMFLFSDVCYYRMNEIGDKILL